MNDTSLTMKNALLSSACRLGSLVFVAMVFVFCFIFFVSQKTPGGELFTSATTADNPNQKGEEHDLPPLSDLTLPAGAFDLSIVGAALPSVSDGGVSAARAQVRAAARGCNNGSYFDSILVAPPLRSCSVLELSSAISAATRDGAGEWEKHRGAPLVVPGCRLEWFFGERVCDLLQAVGGLDLHGDSLIRHLQTTIRSLAIGNLEDGTSRHMGDKAYMCECDYSYDDGHLHRFPGDISSSGNAQCRTYTLGAINLTVLRATWPDYCPRWGTTDYLPTYVWPQPVVSRAAIQLLEGGLGHSTLDMSTVDLVYQKLPGVARRYIFATLWAPGANKPQKYQEAFGKAATIAFNKAIKERAAKLNAVVFDAYAVTFNTPSIDGQHYFKATNVDLAQVLLNLIAALHREDLEASASGAVLP